MASKASLLLGFLLTVAFLGIAVKEAQASEPSLLFSETTIKAEVGETFSVEVIVDTGGEVAYGVGAKVSFDPKILEVVSVQPGTIFGDYPAASYDNTSGKIIVSGIASSQQNFIKDRAEFATLTFRAKKQGITSVQFIYEPGSTTDSNIAVTYGTGDILSQVSQLSVNVIPGSQDSPDTSVTAEVPTQTLERESLFTKILRFFGLSTEPATTREGRPVSGPIGAYRPIPPQQPITDPNQEQPLIIAGSSDDKPLARFAKIFLAAFLIVVLALLGKWLLSRFRKKPATIVQKL